MSREEKVYQILCTHGVTIRVEKARQISKEIVAALRRKKAKSD